MEQRRNLLKAAAAGGAAMALTPAARVARAQANPRELRPQEGDRFVLGDGDKRGAVVKIDDLKAGGPPVTVYPWDAKTGTIRDGSRLNQVLMVRLDEAQLKNDTKLRAAQGVVAYSAVCTHTGCDGLSWAGDKGLFKCPCHESEFDATDGARVVNGPAPRRLPAVPLKVVDGFVVAAGPFTARAGVIQ
jgi:Rieske Fe-S protein